MKKIRLCIILLLVLSHSVTRAQLGSGIDGPLAVTSPGTTIDGTRAEVVNIIPNGGGQDLILGFSTGTWTVGDKVLIILMSQTGGPVPTRNWQMADITGVPGSGMISVTNFAHTNWCTGSAPLCQIQVIRVPQYAMVDIVPGASLTCTPWDGTTGGVLCFLATGNLTIHAGGWIDVAGKGFRSNMAGGFGGIGGATPATPAPNLPGLSIKGNDGFATRFPFFPEGQCVQSGGLDGGDGGTGGFRTPGQAGIIGATAETRQDLPRPATPKLLMMGNGGRQGNGGMGGGAGGSGSNGGNGGGPSLGTTGMPGMNGGMGGFGGIGGTGGGVIIALCNNIFTPMGTSCIDISGKNGSPGMPGITGGGAGDGGNGGEARCLFPGLYVGYGAFGVRGQRGDGAAGGGGGSGGSIGSFSIRVTTGNINQIDKTTNIVYNAGGPGPGGVGQPPVPPSTDGIDGCPEDAIACGATLCTKRAYDTYGCACFEAYQVLGDMDVVNDYGPYIKFSKSPGSSATNKKNGAAITADPDNYYCLYYKCSNLLMAFEDAGTPATTMFRISCTGSPVAIYDELKANVYWCKLNENPCGTCDRIHFDHASDLLRGLPSIVSGSGTLGTATSVTGLTHEFGNFSFGNDGTAVGGSRFQYSDNSPYSVQGNGQLIELSSPANTCNKTCRPFRTEWIDLYTYYPCSCPPPGGSGGTWGGPPPPPEIYPRLPYIFELWDNPEKGDDGQIGEPGEGDDSFFDGGDFVQEEENGMSELLGINDLAAAGRFFAVSPNPAGNQLSVSVKGVDYLDKADIRILDISGKLVFEKQGCNVINKTIVQDISRLQSGTYFISITGKQTSEVLKFVKQ